MQGWVSSCGSAVAVPVMSAFRRAADFASSSCTVVTSASAAALFCAIRFRKEADMGLVGGVVGCDGRDTELGTARVLSRGVAMCVAMGLAGGAADGAARSAGEPTDGMSRGAAEGLPTGMARGTASGVGPSALRSSRKVADLACSCLTMRASSSASRLSSMTFGVHAGSFGSVRGGGGGHGGGVAVSGGGGGCDAVVSRGGGASVLGVLVYLHTTGVHWWSPYGTLGSDAYERSRASSAIFHPMFVLNAAT